MFPCHRLFYRAYQVLNKPLGELASLLGFDIPPTPLIDLANIKSDGAIIHWSLPNELRHRSSLKFEIHLNGSVIQTVPIQESAVTITGLLPGSFYVVRVGLVNSVDFGSRSAPIRFQTKPASAGDFFVPTAAEDGDHAGARLPVPRVLTYSGLKDIAPASPDIVPLSREGSSGLGSRRSTIGLRRPSPAHPGGERNEAGGEDGEVSEVRETIQQLTEKLDEIRRETDEAERNAKEDEEDELRQKEQLIEERDRLKAESSERDKASKNLRREVNILERQNTTAQNERLKHDRIVQQKRQERQKLKDDAIKWEREAVELKREVESLRQERIGHIAEAKQQKEALAERQATEVLSIKALEDQVKAKTIEVKKLEVDMKESATNGVEWEPNLVQQMQQDADEKRRWDMHYNALQHEYAIAVQKEQQAKQFYDEQLRYLQSLRARRRQEDLAQYSSPPSTQERIPRRADSQRSRRAQSGQSSSDSPRLVNFPMSSSAFAPGMTSTSSIFAPAGSSFLNFQNGMTPAPPMYDAALSDEDKERLTGGALMSPTAGADLLPADLFTDGDSKPQYVQPLPGLGPEFPGLREEPAQSPYDQSQTGPASPASSHSHSVFASPQASQQNLHLGSPENVIDADRRSIRSTRSNRATSGGNAGSRFSGMFGIKSRSKAVSTDEALALGKVQSHSMPKNEQTLPGLDSATRKRNSSISGSVFNGPSTTDGGLDGASDSAPRRRPFTFFNKEKGWPSTFGPRPESPRPVSTHSNELPRPSTDSNRWMLDPWPATDAAGGNRSSPLAFGAGWNPPSGQQSRLYGSRLPSRRPSAQYSIHGLHEDIFEDDDMSDVLGPDQETHLAPIGTKPNPGPKENEKQPAVDNTKLNPAAKDFKSFFSSRKSRDKDKNKEGALSTITGTPNLDGAEFDDSRPASSKSKETRDGLFLTNTLDSSVFDSGRESPNMTRTPSYTNSEAAPSPLLGGNSVGKESFMQKLSRKSSSGKFALPTFKREKMKLDTSGATSAPSSSYSNANNSSTTPTSSTHHPAEDDEDAISASVGSIRESRESRETSRGSIGGRGWSNVLKLSKKKGNKTPSLSGMSLTSGGTTEDGDGEDEGL